MYSAFVKLLNMSAASGILIVAVIGLRFLLRNLRFQCIQNRNRRIKCHRTKEPEQNHSP